jgi:hypothetical protein
MVIFYTRAPSTREICLPRWETKTMEVVGVDARDLNGSRNIRSQKQCGSVSLKACVLEACDPNTYAYAHGQLEWERVINNEYHFLMNMQTWDLVPRPQGNNVVKC